MKPGLRNDGRLRASRWRIGFTAAAVLLTSTACSTLRVGSDYDRSATFSGYHTYAWLPREHSVASNPLVARHAHEAIDAILRSKGYTPVDDPANADFTVDFTVGSRDRIDVQSYPMAYRGPWHWGLGYYGSDLDVRQYREGTLGIDIFDGRTHQPVWTGWARKALTQADLERSEGPIREAAAAVLQRFPPS